MRFNSGILLQLRTRIALETGLILAALAHVLPLARGQVSEAGPPALDSAPPSVSQAEAGPERLKKEVRITVETNAPPAGASTNAVAPKEKSFQWKFAWEGWNGLNYGLSQKTMIKDPLAAWREKLQGTNAYRTFHLEAVKMEGKFGAKLQVDAAAYVTSKDFTGFDDGIEVRRARIYAQGDCLLLVPVSYELELGYIPNQFYIENSYLAFSLIDWLGPLKFGQYQPPMGLDAIISSRDTTLMEIAAPLEALAPGTSAGIQLGRPVFDQRATWKLGFFAQGVGTDSGDATANYGRAISRITGLPIYKTDPGNPDSTALLHLGLSANILYSASSSVRYRSRPESHLAPYVIDTGNMNADGALVAGAEVAWVNGPFSIQSEYLRSWVHKNNGQVPGFDGVYATVSWFLTGETRPYDRQNGCFTRVIPHHNFDWGKGGWGAWEIAARYSFVNLNSADVNGGRLSELMTGVNWYLHSHVKWRFEYGYGHVAGKLPDGNINIFQTRMEVDF